MRADGWSFTNDVTNLDDISDSECADDSETTKGAQRGAFVLPPCPICLDQTLLLASTKCGHVYCYDCISRAVSKQGRCPTCRAALRPKDIHRLYLHDSQPHSR
uniref:E3 ubiquitin-protein ligase Bre1 n=1 Tax=Lygus hesperus TaxID=30085 RepID=A0A0A9WHX1_LYGHE